MRSASKFYALLTVVVGLLISETASGQGGEVFVANGGSNSITVYSRSANGNTVPLRTIIGAATGLNSPSALVVDSTYNEVFVVNQGAIPPTVTVYSRFANGNVAPVRVLTGAATGLDGPNAVALDLTNNELLVLNNIGLSVTVYQRAAAGNTAPLRTLTGLSTGLSDPRGLAVDTTNNELFVVNNADNSVTVYNRTAMGNTAPVRTLVGGATAMNTPVAVAVDPLNDELFVSNIVNLVTVYPRAASGNVAPIRSISGGATQMFGPVGVALDLVSNELFVVNSNFATNSVVVHRRGANGDPAPLRKIQGAATGIDDPNAIAVTANTLAVERDFNGDGTTDFLWRKDSGTPAIWLMNGATPIASAVLPAVTNDWTIIDVGDFNGDGRADILWRHSSGLPSIWFMNGLAIASTTILPVVGLDWSIERLGDCNGDGTTDIVWRHTSGAVSIWFMNGVLIAGVSSAGTPSTDWQLR